MVTIHPFKTITTTNKAVLIEFYSTDHSRVIKKWFPKSQVEINNNVIYVKKQFYNK